MSYIKSKIAFYKILLQNVFLLKSFSKRHLASKIFLKITARFTTSLITTSLIRTCFHTSRNSVKKYTLVTVRDYGT